jgi:hypothetical protein
MEKIESKFLSKLTENKQKIYKFILYCDDASKNINIFYEILLQYFPKIKLKDIEVLLTESDKSNKLDLLQNKCVYIGNGTYNDLIKICEEDFVDYIEEYWGNLEIDI